MKNEEIDTIIRLVDTIEDLHQQEIDSIREEIKRLEVIIEEALSCFKSMRS